MFGFLKKKQKSDLEKQIEKDGIDYAAKRFTEIVLRKLPTKEIAYQFILEEIEAASQGNSAAIDFAKKSGIAAQKYKGSLNNSRPEVDGPGGPQQMIFGWCAQLSSNIDLMVGVRIRVADNIMRFFSFGKYEGQEEMFIKGGVMLEPNVVVLFVVRNDTVIYINNESDSLFAADKDGDEKLNGRVVNFVFIGQEDRIVTEVFVAFDDADSYTMFTLQTGMDERLNHVARAIFNYFHDASAVNVFSPVEKYASQFIYTFKLYRRNRRYFMVNNTQTQAYLIDKSGVSRGVSRSDVDKIKSVFWGG